MHTQLGNKKMQVQEERKSIWKRGRRLRSIMMIWQGDGASFLAQGMGHGDREIYERMGRLRGQRGETCEVMGLKGLNLPHLFFE